MKREGSEKEGGMEEWGDGPWVLWFGEGSGRKQAAVETEAIVVSGATAGVAGAAVAVATGQAWRESFHLASQP